MGNYLSYKKLEEEQPESDCEKNKYCKKQNLEKNDVRCGCKKIKKLLEQESERISTYV